MKAMRGFFFFLITAALAAFALPVLGASQPSAGTYDMTITVTGPVTLRVVLTNVTTTSMGKGSNTNNNNATITSFSITFNNAAPASGAVVTGAGGTTTPKKNTVFTPSGNTLYVSSFYPLKPDGSQLVFDITLGDCGDNITIANAVVSTSTGALPGGSGLPFAADATATAALGATYVVACGTLACGGSQPVPASSYHATIARGTYDKDGETTIATGLCETVDYTVTTFDAKTKHVFWPTSGTKSDKFAAFMYKINNPSLTNVGWLANLTPPPPVAFIAGPLCLSQPVAGGDAILPAPYGKLAADDTGGATISVVVGMSGGAVVTRPAVGNFDVIIGTDRLTVNYASGSGTETWNVVTRHVGGQSGPDGLKDAPVMYTPLPLLPGVDPADGVTPLPAVGSPYASGMQAQVCIVKHTATDTTFIDIGDGWVNQP
jgi:hypothetical protein